MKQAKRKTRINKKVLWLVDAVLLAALLFALIRLVMILSNYRENRRQYDAIAQMAVATVTPAPSETPAPAAMPQPSETPPPSELPITVDWEALKQVNADVVAWIFCEGTPISYPVVQRRDNEYYLARSFERKKSSGGALFLDCRNLLGAPESNVIIYGHRMKDNSMFGVLPDYADEAFFKEHPVMYLLTEAQSYRVEVFACRTVRGDAKYFPTYFESTDQYVSYLRKAVAQSYWQTGEEVDASVSTLTLSTCSSYTHADNPRLLVHGRMIPVS